MAKRRKKKEESGELYETMKSVKARCGERSVRKGNEVYQPDRISTGSFIMDFATLGGFPVNRASMIVGERHSGKSTLANKAIASTLRQYPDQTPVLLDIEGTFDATWAEALGVDLDRLLVVECDTGEMAVDVGAAVIQSMETSLVVVDSIAALSPMKEQEDSAEDANVALQARLAAKFVRKVTSGMIKERQRNHIVTLLHLNQFRTKIGGYGDPRTLPGGRALEYSTSFQVIIKNKENKGRDSHGVETMTHNEHPYTITKNKMNNGPRTGEFTLIREEQEENNLAIGDIDDSGTILSYAKKFGIYTGGGTKWRLEFADHALSFGKAAEAIGALREDYDLYWDLRTHLIRLQALKYNMPRQFVERIV